MKADRMKAARVRFGSAAAILLSMAMGCGRESGEAGRQDPEPVPETRTNYPEENAIGDANPERTLDTATRYPPEGVYDTARESPPAVPAAVDTAVRSVPEAGKRLDVGDTGIVAPKGTAR